MSELAPWGAPVVFTYDLSGRTRGGGSVFLDETTFATSSNAGFPPS